DLSQPGALSAVGDNFASAIPIELGKTMLAKNNIENDTGSYSAALTSGLTLLSQNHCKAAIDQFAVAKSVNGNFNPAAYTDPFTAQCQALIASGQSIDSSWGATMAYFRSLGWPVWAIIGGSLVGLFLFVLVAIRLARRSKKDEEEIAKLEEMVAK